MEYYAQKLREIIDESNNIVFFGGAGVSTESGIPDFRGSDGLFNQNYKYHPEKIISHAFFEENTKEFYDFYRDRMVYADAKPNKAHVALADLERQGKLTAVITQNIDGLHQMAGSKNVFELHGSIHRNYCMNCGKFYGLDKITESCDVPICDECGGIIKPDVVLYQENLNPEILNEAENIISQADTLIIGGTSLVVYPAAAIVYQFRGSKIVFINKSTTSADNTADLIIREPVGQVFGEAFGI